MAARLIRGLLNLLRAWWKRKGSFAISLAVATLALVVYATTFVGERATATSDFIQRLELETLDLRFRWRGRASPDPRIAIVDIDQRSQEILGRWPFPRSHFAAMLDALREDGARVVAFDITFSKPDETAGLLRELGARLENQQRKGLALDPRLRAEIARLEAEYDHDRKFAQAIQRFGRVVLGNFFLYTDADLRGLDDATLHRYANLVAYFPYPQVRATETARGVESYRNLIQQFADLSLLPRGAQANLEMLTEALPFETAATGFFNVFPDADGVVRRVPLVLPYGRARDFADWDLYASLEVQAVRLFLGLENEQVVLSFGEAGIEAVEFGPGIRVRPDELGRVMVNYQGRAATYPYVSIGDVVTRQFRPGTFKGKLVLVGASATGIGDLRITPYGGLDYPGVEVHANAIDNILNNRFLVRGARQVLWDLAMVALFGLPVGVWLALASPRWMVLPLVLLVPFTVLVYFAFRAGWWLNFVTPAGTLVANTLLVSLYRVLIEEREKRRVRGAFQQYLSPEVIRQLLESPELVQPRKTEITVMFSDIRGFTTISEALDAQELAVLLNGYLTEMTQVIFRHHGTLDKYIGDAIMAFWGAPYQEPEHAGRACRAALEMMARLGELQKQWSAQGLPPIDIGLGINTGVASVGNMGSELRYGYTAMGDAVNLASRLEGLNKEYSTHILLTETTYAAISNGDYYVRELDLIRVKGKLKPVTIYELLPPPAGDGGSPTQAASGSAAAGVPAATGQLKAMLALFSEGRALYRQRRWREAKACFEQLLARWPTDGPARVFASRCEEYLAEEPPPGWDGVYVMKHK